MAYHIYVFAITGDPVVQRLLPQLVEAVERIPGVNAVNLRDGVATASCHVVSAGFDGDVLLTVKTQPGIVRLMIELERRRKGAENLVADTMVELILAGDTDWRVVRAICEVAVERWSGVICHEGGDHVASLADLP